MGAFTAILPKHCLFICIEEQIEPLKSFQELLGQTNCNPKLLIIYLGRGSIPVLRKLSQFVKINIYRNKNKLNLSVNIKIQLRLNKFLEIM